jgi:succinate dehydrogenase/fumarate reductase flavoprotein subunit
MESLHGVPVVTVNTVVVGTGSAGFCAADRLWELSTAAVARHVTVG